MAMKLITAPAAIVTWAEADAFLGLGGDTSKQALVESLIAAATQYLDGWNGILGRAIGAQTWELSLDAFPGGEIKIPLPALISVESVKYDDADGNEQTVSAANYDVDDRSYYGWVVPTSSYSWPATIDAINAVRIRFQSGYVTVPAPFKTAILLKIGRMYSMATLGNVSVTGGILRSETVEGVGSQTFGSGSDVIQIMQQSTEAEEYLLGPYRVFSV